jgi:hypothetical protein
LRAKWEKAQHSQYGCPPFNMNDSIESCAVKQKPQSNGSKSIPHSTKKAVLFSLQNFCGQTPTATPAALTVYAYVKPAKKTNISRHALHTNTQTKTHLNGNFKQAQGNPP